MKEVPQTLGTWDRVATREELCQVFDLLESIPQVRGGGRSSQNPTFPVSLANVGAQDDSSELWLDQGGEPGDAQAVDASLESLAELFANGSYLIN